MSEERTRPQPSEDPSSARGDEKAREEGPEFAIPDCCGPMIETLKKAFAEARAGDSPASDSCAAMMAQMMKTCREAFGDQAPSARRED